MRATPPRVNEEIAAVQADIAYARASRAIVPSDRGSAGMPVRPASARLPFSGNDSILRLPRNFPYGYDLAGNRTREEIDTSLIGSTFNKLNELTAQSAGCPMEFAGTVNRWATIEARIDCNQPLAGKGVAYGQSARGQPPGGGLGATDYKLQNMTRLDRLDTLRAARQPAEQ
jgi:hypothetical protein